MTTRVIKVSEKWSKFDRYIQLRDIADKLTTLLYGKSLADCLGKPQSIMTKRLKSMNIANVIVEVNSSIWSYKFKKLNFGVNVPDYGDETYTYSDNVSLQKYITNIVNHAKKENINITLNFL